MILPGILLAILFFSASRVPFYTADPAGFKNRSDFDDYFQAGILIRSGKDPYRMDNIKTLLNQASDISGMSLADAAGRLRGAGSYIYPPFTASLLSPLAPLEYMGAAAVYQLFSMACLFFALFFLYKYSLRAAGPGIYFASLSAALLLLFRFQAENALNGNVAFFLIFLCGAGLLFAFEPVSYLEFLGGFLIGVAGGIKITPLYLGATLLAGRKFRAISGMAVGLLFTFLIPAVFSGFERNLEYLKNWYLLVFDSYGKVVFVRAWANNQTITGAIGKLFIPGSDNLQPAYSLPLIYPDSMPPAGYLAGMALFARILALVPTLVSAFLGIFAFLMLYRKKVSSLMNSLFFITLVEICTLASLLGSGVSWYHAYAVLFIPVFLRLRLHFSGKEILRGGEMYTFLFYGFFGLVSSVLSFPMREWLSIFSIFTWGLCVVFVYKTVLALRVCKEEKDQLARA